MAPSTMQQWSIDAPESDFSGMRYMNVPVPKVGDDEVLIKFKAASINFRDLAIAKGTFPFAHKYPIVPVSDGAGEVVDVGKRVIEFKKGDMVLTLFNQGHQSGDIDPEASSTGVWGTIDGVLREYGVFKESGLVKAPSNLNAVEASTLPCAALTSWNALYGLKPLQPGQTVLVQGTGGVSIFGLQFAKAAGATVIATTSSAEKMEKLKKLGADHVVHYKTNPDWGDAVRQLTTNQRGVDYILEVGGPGAFEQSLKCIKMDGTINVIGFLGSSKKPQPGLIEALSHICIIRGLYVGSKAMFKDMIRSIETYDLHPVVADEIFKLEQAKEAYEYMHGQTHFGKVVIKID
ncbi:hypothetical protein F5884DRAFT_885009 [Xylogone sp. PMI_703]|nr:hypothetical protein F5884DRAFT_885009 [Xylogone sp. PMI_703]